MDLFLIDLYVSVYELSHNNSKSDKITIRNCVQRDTMGVEFHITRAEYWAENDEAQITSDEWISYINSDDELSIDYRNGDYHAQWSGPSLYDDPWLDWSDGNIYTKWPDTYLYRKMLKIAKCLNAQVMDDEGTIYSDESDWEHNPS